MLRIEGMNVRAKFGLAKMLNDSNIVNNTKYLILHLKSSLIRIENIKNIGSTNIFTR